MVDKELFDRYARALSANADVLAARIAELSAALDGLDGDDLYRALAREYSALCAEHGRYAAEAAVEFYAELRGIADPGSRYEPTAVDPDNRGLTAFDVKEALGSSDTLEKAVSKLKGSGGTRAYEYADETILYNSTVDPAKPKLALVPSAKACDWCLMLASRGFAYRTQATATAARHPNCKCVVVVDFDVDNPSLEGYDHAALVDYYEKNLKEKWSSRRRSGPRAGGSSGGGAFSSIGDVQRYLDAAESVEDMERRNGVAMAALDRMFSGKARDKAYRLASVSARERYRKLAEGRA